MAKTGKNNKGSDAIKKAEPEKYQRRWGNQFQKAYTEEEIDRIADDMYDWFQIKENFWLKDFAVQRLISRQRISEFVKASNYFKWIYELCKDIQESKTIRLGMSKKFNPALPVLMLKNNHGWVDRVDNSFQAPDELPEFENKTDEEIEQTIKTLQKKNGNGNGNGNH